MAKGLKWSRRAQNDRKAIFDYWNHRNRSAAYSRKLNALFLHALDAVMEYPESGVDTDVDGIRFTVVRDFKIFYEHSGDYIHVHAIFDTRQNPDKLIDLLSSPR